MSEQKQSIDDIAVDIKDVEKKLEEMKIKETGSTASAWCRTPGTSSSP